MTRRGGMSFSNNFIVSIVPKTGIGADDDLNKLLEFYCQEAQLPNINTLEGSHTGMYQGMGQIKYPVARVFTEVQLGFALDANLNLLKFFNGWHDAIFNETPGTSVGSNKEQRPIRLSYKDSYNATMLIQKTETGPNSPVQRDPITYVLENVYPYAIDAVPLQFGASQITQLTVQLSYNRHYTINKDITAVKGDVNAAYTEEQLERMKYQVVSGITDEELKLAQKQTGLLDLYRPYSGTTGGGEGNRVLSDIA